MEQQTVNERLRALLQKLEDWQKAPTNILGVSIIKIPAKATTPPRLGIEINPVDSAGKPIKKGGAIVVTNLELFQMYLKLFTNPKLLELMQEVENIRNEICPNEDVFEL